MKIKRIALIMAVIMAFGGVSSFAKTLEFTIGSENFYVSEGSVEKKALEAAPYTENSRTMVPVRAISENFGAEVSWNDADEKVTIVSGDTTVELIINSDIAKINGEEKKLDTPAITVNGRTMVPLRFVSEALKKSVEYIELTEQILISDEVLKIGNEVVNIDDYKACALLYGVSITKESAEFIVPQITAMLKEQYAVANEAKSKGFVLSDEIKAMILEEMRNPEIQEMVYSSTLVASAVKYYTNYFTGMEYVDSLVTLPDASAIEEIYKKDYIRAKHILIMGENTEQAKKTIADIKKKLDKGEDFDKLMAELSEDPGSKSNPDGYVFTYGEMVEEFEKAAFALKEGEISDVVESSFGYHIIKREPLPQVDIEEFLAGGAISADYNAINSILEKNAQASMSENVLKIIENTQYNEILSNEEIIKALTAE